MDLAAEVNRLNGELAQERAQNAALREALEAIVKNENISTDTTLPFHVSGRSVAEFALASPASGWPDMVVALVKGARQTGVNRDLLAPFEGVD